MMWWSIFEIGLLLWHHWKWTGGVETSFCWTKYMWQGYFAIKLDQFPFFGLEWCSENFTPAYRGSPPPAVFHDKSQMTNMKNTAGKSARVDGEWDLDFDGGEGGALMVRWFRDWEFKTVMNGMVMMVRKYEGIVQEMSGKCKEMSANGREMVQDGMEMVRKCSGNSGKVRDARK